MLVHVMLEFEGSFGAIVLLDSLKRFWLGFHFDFHFDCKHYKKFKSHYVSGMGDGARRRLQVFANNFENKMKGINNPNNAAAGSGLQEARGAAAERRGLLDDDDYGDDMIEFETRKSR